MNGTPTQAKPEELIAIQGELRSLFGSDIILDHVLEMSRKSTVLLVVFKGKKYIAKCASASSLRSEWQLYSSILPALHVAAPRAHRFEEVPNCAWLLLDYVPGRHASLLTDDRDVRSATCWAAQLHSASWSSEDLMAGLSLPGARQVSQIMEAIKQAIGSRKDRTQQEKALAFCDVIARAVPLIIEAEALLQKALTHGDLFDENLIVPHGDDPNRIFAIDWEKAAMRSPAVDLCWLDMTLYESELRTRGYRINPTDLWRSKIAGRVLFEMSRNFAAKSFREQLSLLKRMSRLADRLAKGPVSE